MLKAIELENVRLFEGTEWKFNLSPLTVFCGTNNSGKSTLLKALLLLRQSQGIGESYGVHQAKLRFVGTQVDSGDYESFVYHNDVGKEIGIALTVEDHMHPSSFEYLRSLGSGIDLSDQSHNSSSPVPYSLRSLFRFGFNIAQDPSEDQSIIASSNGHKRNGHSDLTASLKKAEFEIHVGDKKLLWWRLEGSYSKENQRIEYKLFAQKNYFDSLSFQTIPSGTIKLSNVAECLVKINHLVPGNLIAKVQDDSSIENGMSETASRSLHIPLPPEMENTVNDLLNALSNIHYLGPLRSRPQRYYITHLDARPPLDPAGEFLPYILKDQDVHEVSYVSPGQADAPQKGTLRQALNSWMYYIRTGNPPERISSDEIAVETTQVLVEFKVKNPFGNQSHALADSGFGYSQILPIIVKGLLLPEGSTFIVEQPELHLNPALQVRLSEFFVSMVRSGKQVIIETHSEHIVNMIRVLAAEDESGELAAKCGLFFIDAQRGKPKIHDLSIRPDGTVPDWPRHFFGEAASLAGRLLRAQRRFRKQRKQRQK